MKNLKRKLLVGVCLLGVFPLSVSLTSCGFFEGNTPPKTEEKSNDSNDNNNQQLPAISKEISLNNVSDFNNNYLLEQVASYAGVDVGNVKIQNPDWKTNIKTDESGKMSVEVSLTVSFEDGSTRTYICIIDLSNIKENLEITINGPEKLSVGSLEQNNLEDLLKKYLVTDMKGRDVKATLSFHNSEAIDLTKPGVYDLMIRAVEDTTKIGAIKNITLEVRKQYKVSFEVNGKIVEEQIVEKGDNVKYNGVTPTKEEDLLYRYEFVGWSEDLTNITEDKIVKANFKEIKTHHKISFFMSDGSVLMSDQYLEIGKKLSEIEGPKFENKNFKGFFLDKHFTKPYDFNSEVTDDLILYAKYADVVEVSFVAKGIHNSNEEISIVKTFEKGTNISSIILDVELELSKKIPDRNHYDYSGIKTTETTITENTKIINLTYEDKIYIIPVKYYNYFSCLSNSKREIKNEVKKVTFWNYLQLINNEINKNHIYNNGYTINVNNMAVKLETIDFDTLRNSKIEVFYNVPEVELTFNNGSNTTTKKTNVDLTYAETLNLIFGINTNPTNWTSVNVNRTYHETTYETSWKQGWFTKKVTFKVSDINNSIDDYKKNPGAVEHLLITIVDGDGYVENGKLLTIKELKALIPFEFLKKLEETSQYINSINAEYRFKGFIKGKHTSYVAPTLMNNYSEVNFINLNERVTKTDDKAEFTLLYEYDKNVRCEVKDSVFENSTTFRRICFLVANPNIFSYDDISKETYETFFEKYFNKYVSSSKFNGKAYQKVDIDHFYNVIKHKTNYDLFDLTFFTNYTNVNYIVKFHDERSNELTVIRKWGETYIEDDIYKLFNVNSDTHTISFYTDVERTKTLPLKNFKFVFPFENTDLYIKINIKSTSSGSSSGNNNGNSSGSDGTSSGSSNSTSNSTGSNMSKPTKPNNDVIEDTIF